VKWLSIKEDLSFSGNRSRLAAALPPPGAASAVSSPAARSFGRIVFAFVIDYERNDIKGRGSVLGGRFGGNPDGFPRIDGHGVDDPNYKNQ
jgi:hypothetical protein